MIAGIIGLVVALAILLKGFAVGREARARRGRLLPVAARVTRRGDMAELRITRSTDAHGKETERHEHVFTGGWEYTVGGQAYRGEVELNAPVFTAEQMPPATIQVFYDRADPSVSRLWLDADRGAATPWFIFAGVAALVSVLIGLIAGLEPFHR
jgi:hypothetical protein